MLVEQQSIESVLRRGFDLCLDLVCLAGFDGHFKLLNQAWETELGYPREELLSRPYLDFVHPDDRERTVREAGQLAGGERTWTFENRYRHKNGSYVWLSWRAAPLPETRAILAIARNVTDRKRQEQKTAKMAEEAQRTLATLFRNLPGMVYRRRNDETSTMEIVSQGCRPLTGYAPEDLIGNRRIAYRDLIHPEDRSGVRALVEQAVGRREPFTIAYRIRTGAGGEKWVWEQGCGVYSATGAPLHLEGYIVDRTAERIARQRIDEQAMLLDEASDAISVRDLNQIVTYWNRGAERLWGWPAEEAIGRNVTELLSQTGDRNFRAALESTLRDGRWSGEFDQVTRDGRKIVVAARWSLIRNAEGQPQSILSLAEDRTEARQMEIQLLRAQRMESIGTLASGIAHDLNNTLAPILMGVEMLRRRGDARDAKTLDVIESSALRGSKLVKQVLTFGRGIEGDRVATDLAHVIREVSGVTAKTFPNSIALKLECPGSLWPVLADPVQLEQVFMNLMVNARDAMADGGTITIRGQNTVLDEIYARMHLDARPGPYVLVEVSDTGSGIPPAVLNRVFEPFFTTKPVGKGTGLGLSTVHSIVTSHGGFVHVYSEVHRGTTFRIYLPASDTDCAASRAAPPQVREGHGELILVVDDEPHVREMARLVLEGSGYRSEDASNGAEAVARYARGGIDAVVVDWSMPIMNGGAAVAAIRSLDPQARILVSSGLADRNEMRSIEPQVPFIAKPYTAEQFLSQVGALFRHAGGDSEDVAS